MSSASWTHRFAISEKELLELRSASAGEPLRAALTSGRVPEHEYLAWAMQTYELPKVKSDFFQIAPDPVFYEAVKRDFKWSPSLVPLAQWNGVLLIGCLEPPQFHFRVPYEARFVLASAQDLLARFETLEPNQRSVVVKPTVTAVTPTATPAPPRQPSQPPPPQAAPVLQPVAPSIELPPSPQTQVTRTLTAADIPTNPGVSLEELMAKPAIDLPTAPDISLDEPDGIVNVPKQASDDSMIVPDGIKVGSVEVPKPAAKKEQTNSAPDGLTEKTFMTQVKIDFGSLTSASPSNPVGNAAAAPPRLSTSEEVTNPQAKIAPFPPTVPRPMPQPADFATAASTPAPGNSIVSNDAPVVPLAQCGSYEDLAASTLGRVLKTFDVGMILLFQNGQLKPWKWTELMFSVKGENPDAVDLNGASIFRIVFRTCLPYHGYVVASPVNTAFFNSFYRGVTPKHATIMPVLINKKVAGMILGLAGREVDLRKTLGEMEILAAEFGTHLDRVKNIKKAA